MGSIDQIEQLETYINDLGDEIKNVKKASDYLKLIEEFQEEVKRTSSNLVQSEHQLKLIQELIESKLALIQITSQSIESKQQAIEQSLNQLIADSADLKRQLQKSEMGMITSFTEMNKVVNEKHHSVISDLKKVKEENETLLREMAKTSKNHFMVNLGFGVCVLGMLVYLLVR